MSNLSNRDRLLVYVGPGGVIHRPAKPVDFPESVGGVTGQYAITPLTLT